MIAGEGGCVMKILLAIDDSDFGEAAMRMVVAQNVPSRTQVRIVTVLEPIVPLAFTEAPMAYGPQLDMMLSDRRKKAKSVLERAAKKLRAKGFRVSTELREGDVRREIVQAAERSRAKLIVLGSHSRKGLSRVVLGSVSEYVARHAHCSVQIVRK
jgi:nucleotide-binding universal stress UspA family protein